MPTPTESAVAVRSAVRSNAAWVGPAALLMLYFGVYGGLEPDPSASWATRLEVGSWGVYYTMRIGGGIMLLSALFCLTGSRRALLFDAFASVCIGLALVVSGALLGFDTGMLFLLLIFFGAIFIHSGYRSWRQYHSLAFAKTPDGKD